MPFGFKYDIGRNWPPRWDDLSTAATRTQQGANGKPDYDETDLGLLFPQNDPTEIAMFIIQMPHRKKLGTGIHLHVHFRQTSAAVPIFRAAARFYNNGAAIPVFANSDSAGTLAFPYIGSPMLNIVSFPLYSPPTGETLSANFDCKIWRIDTAVAGDVLVKYIDAHWQEDSQGSREEFVK